MSGFDPYPPAEHVDRHDGEHLWDCHRIRREGVPEGLGEGQHMNVCQLYKKPTQGDHVVGAFSDRGAGKRIP